VVSGIIAGVVLQAVKNRVNNGIKYFMCIPYDLLAAAADPK
jgi:hypothetical protein